MTNRSRLLPTASAGLLLAAAVPAQGDRQLDARVFLPNEYTVELRVDMARIVDTGVWSTLERSPVRMLFGAFEDGFGFTFDELREVRWAMRETYGRADDQGEVDESDESRAETWVLIGDASVTVDGLRRARGEDGPAEQIAGRPAVDAPGGAWVGVCDGMLVKAERALIERALAGEFRGGVPSGDLLALLAADRGEPLARLCGMLPPPDIVLRRGMDPIPASWLERDDAPRGLMLRLDGAPVEGSEELALTLRGRMRFARGDSGRDLFHDKLAAWLGELREDARMGGLHDALGAATVRTEAKDVVLEIPLGVGGGALAGIGQVLMLGLRPEPDDVPADTGPVEAPPAEPAPERRR
ncbi:MAG: hypothetical protein IPM29_01280 [Planctomycetes bacterium]|nr:hypothetical protein [Planctomycetota bacterium]